MLQKGMRKLQIWNYLFLPFMLFNLLGPFAITYPWFNTTVTIAYVNKSDYFALNSQPVSLKSILKRFSKPLQDVISPLNAYLIPSMIILTILSTIIMITTFIVYSSQVSFHGKRKKQSEDNVDGDFRLVHQTHHLKQSSSSTVWPTSPSSCLLPL